jgi:enoyl-CoA hydratase/carnithine racemase
VSVLLHSFGDGVGRITLNRPDRMNAVTTELANQLEHALRELSAEPTVNVIVIRGAGKNFCAGGDATEVRRRLSAGRQPLRTLFAAFRGACDAISAADVPVIAAVEGVAMAGGFELMQAADIVIVSDDAKIADSHINFGMIPGGGSTQRLPHLVGRQTALGLLLSGDCLNGLDAVRIGLAYRSFAPEDFDAGVHEFVTKLAGRDRIAMATIKKLVEAGQERPLAQGLDDEITAVVEHIAVHGADELRRVGTPS